MSDSYQRQNTKKDRYIASKNYLIKVIDKKGSKLRGKELFDVLTDTKYFFDELDYNYKCILIDILKNKCNSNFFRDDIDFVKRIGNFKNFNGASKIHTIHRDLYRIIEPYLPIFKTLSGESLKNFNVLYTLYYDEEKAKEILEYYWEFTYGYEECIMNNISLGPIFIELLLSKKDSRLKKLMPTIKNYFSTNFYNGYKFSIDLDLLDYYDSDNLNDLERIIFSNVSSNAIPLKTITDNFETYFKLINECKLKKFIINYSETLDLEDIRSIHQSIINYISGTYDIENPVYKVCNVIDNRANSSSIVNNKLDGALFYAINSYICLLYDNRDNIYRNYGENTVIFVEDLLYHLNRLDIFKGYFSRYISLHINDAVNNISNVYDFISNRKNIYDNQLFNNFVITNQDILYLILNIKEIVNNRTEVLNCTNYETIYLMNCLIIYLILDKFKSFIKRNTYFDLDLSYIVDYNVLESIGLNENLKEGLLFNLLLREISNYAILEKENDMKSYIAVIELLPEMKCNFDESIELVNEGIHDLCNKFDFISKKDRIDLIIKLGNLKSDFSKDDLKDNSYNYLIGENFLCSLDENQFRKLLCTEDSINKIYGFSKFNFINLSKVKDWFSTIEDKITVDNYNNIAAIMDNIICDWSNLYTDCYSSLVKDSKKAVNDLEVIDYIISFFKDDFTCINNGKNIELLGYFTNAKYYDIIDDFTHGYYRLINENSIVNDKIFIDSLNDSKIENPFDSFEIVREKLSSLFRNRILEEILQVINSGNIKEMDSIINTRVTSFTEFSKVHNKNISNPLTVYSETLKYILVLFNSKEDISKAYYSIFKAYNDIACYYGDKRTKTVGLLRNKSFIEYSKYLTLEDFTNLIMESPYKNIIDKYNENFKGEFPNDIMLILDYLTHLDSTYLNEDNIQYLYKFRVLLIGRYKILYRKIISSTVNTGKYKFGSINKELFELIRLFDIIKLIYGEEFSRVIKDKNMNSAPRVIRDKNMNFASFEDLHLGRFIKCIKLALEGSGSNNNLQYDSIDAFKENSYLTVKERLDNLKENKFIYNKNNVYLPIRASYRSFTNDEGKEYIYNGIIINVKDVHCYNDSYLRNTFDRIGNVMLEMINYYDTKDIYRISKLNEKIKEIVDLLTLPVECNNNEALISDMSKVSVYFV